MSDKDDATPTDGPASDELAKLVAEIRDEAVPTDSGDTAGPTESASPWRKRLTVTGTGALVLAVIYALLVSLVGTDIPVGTRIAGLNVGHMTADAARPGLATIARQFDSKKVTLVSGDTKSTLTVAELGISFNVAETLDAVPQAGLNPLPLIQQLLTGGDVAPVLSTTDALDQNLAAFAETVDHPARNATVILKGLVPSVRAARDGKVLDVARSRSMILERLAGSVNGNPIKITLPTVTDFPVIDDAAAQNLIKSVVTPALSHSVTVNAVGGKANGSWTYKPKDLAAAMRFKVVDGKLTAVLNPAAISAATGAALAAVEVPVRNATWDVSSGVPVIVPEKDGFGVSDESLARSIESALLLPIGHRTVTVQFGVLKPTFTAADAAKLGVTELVSTYKQKFPYAAYRVTNIGQAARYINGTLLKPGDIYSMNKTIRERTYENGYTDGWIIARGGVFTMEPGGGVSTATTAMFNGAWFAGLKFIEHRAHSIWIPDRYVPGREATVFWGSLDMRFQNDSPNGIFITTKMTPTSITVSFWGTKQFDRIDTEFGPKTAVTSPRTIYNADPVCHEQNGVIGFHIRVWRTFYVGAEQIRREPFDTVYNAAPNVICSATPKPTPTKTTKKPTVKKTTKVPSTPPASSPATSPASAPPA